ERNRAPPVMLPRMAQLEEVRHVRRRPAGDLCSKGRDHLAVTELSIHGYLYERPEAGFCSVSIVEQPLSSPSARCWGPSLRRITTIAFAIREATVQLGVSIACATSSRHDPR